MILILNCGSSSLKFSFFSEKNEVACCGKVDNIGSKKSTLEITINEETRRQEVSTINHRQAFSIVSDTLDQNLNTIDQIEAVGHRIVHGGTLFKNPTEINNDVLLSITSCIPLAPLHNPASLNCIFAAQNRFPSIPHIAVFDTAFYSTLPSKAYLYAIPKNLYYEKGIRRFGFHGCSHEYIAKRCAELLRKDFDRFNCITCHLGNGVSLSAVENGKCVDTTMGYPPLEGVAMGTRSGDIDPGLIFALAREGMDLEDIEHMLQKKSGLLGLSGTTFDVRALEQAAFGGDDNAQNALDVFAYRIRKALGGFYAALGKVDAIIFTGGIGQNSTFMRHHILDGLESLGILIDSVRNRVHNEQESEISNVDGRVKIWIIPTKEELIILAKTREVLNRDIDYG